MLGLCGAAYMRDDGILTVSERFTRLENQIHAMDARLWAALITALVTLGAVVSHYK